VDVMQALATCPHSPELANFLDPVTNLGILFANERFVRQSKTIAPLATQVFPLIHTTSLSDHQFRVVVQEP